MNMKRILVATLALIVVFGGGLFAGYKFFKLPIPELPEITEVVVEDNTEEVIQAITRSEQVVLLSMHIQGIKERTQKSTFFGVEVPGSDRAIFIQYTFNAKLGMDGADVLIEKTGEDEFTITIPEFVFIGHDDINLKTATEANGVLSWVTPEIDTVDMANEILGNDERAGYVVSNDAILRDQARAFYDGIIKAVDPAITLLFTFTPAESSDDESTQTAP
ncbi:MAG: efflux RND transporter permease subunit [Rhodococcus sp. (in: high G+C Gram-positive bacteria)]|nr:efflux RND transporter permease subunit [Rhodococcus sp. (in: high G+C Gram-positive bacteria)]